MALPDNDRRSASADAGENPEPFHCETEITTERRKRTVLKRLAIVLAASTGLGRTIAGEKGRSTHLSRASAWR
ncbi:hypothetical protein [Streptomyces sp. NPDC002619]|uniref:hypothetical protein n=1 Tax=Streptomyces sp. NPDC002619 TaxID=3364655 RepID=UPI0036809C21